MESGIKLLEPFLSSRFNDWWPLYYYLGIGYEMTGKRADAVSAFRKSSPDKRKPSRYDERADRHI